MWEQYRISGSIKEAVSALSEEGGAARIIAGGTDLILEIERGVRKDIKTLIDISAIPGQDEITEDQNGVIHIGPLVTHNHILSSRLIREKANALAQACWEVGSPQIRNRGTIAGNLVTGSPANDTISPLMAFNAKLCLESTRGKRVVALEDFYHGVRKTDLAQDELVTDIFFDAPDRTRRSYFIKSALRKAQAISVINISVVLTIKGDSIQDPIITLGAVAPTIIHAAEAEAFLVGKNLVDTVIDRAGELTAKAANPISDIRGSADYRTYLIKVMVKRALKKLRDGVEKEEIPNQPVLLMGSGTRTPIPKQPWDGKEIHTWINGKEYRFKSGFDKTLLHLIREEAGMSGTKEGCGEGECGACTVFLDGRAVMSCLVPAPRAHGSEIVTIEGLADGDVLHPLQDAFIEYGAIQCGYCTPGFLMSAAKLLEERMTPSQQEIRQAITGNLCRCTGYYKIIEAIDKASKQIAADKV